MSIIGDTSCWLTYGILMIWLFVCNARNIESVIPVSTALIVVRLISNINNIYLLGSKGVKTEIGASIRKIYPSTYLDF